MTTQPNYDLDLKLAELKINGYVTFEDLIPVETIDRIREAFLPLLEEVKTHSNTEGEDVEVRGHTDDRLVVEGRLQIVNRYTMYVPWEQPFADPQIFENPVMLDFLDRYWGTSDYHITCYHSNNPYPGSRIPTVASRCGDFQIGSPRRLRGLSPFWHQVSHWWIHTKKMVVLKFCPAPNTSLIQSWRIATTKY